MLQRRARRRLVGAVALVLLIVIVLPLVFDREPRPITQDLVIEIPSQDSGKFAPRIQPQPPAPAEPAKAPVLEPPRVPAPEGKIEPPAKTEPAAKAEAPAKAAPAKSEPEKSAESEARRAQAILESETFVVPLGAYMNPANAKQVQSRAAAAGYKAYAEKFKGSKGEQLRVRAGPFTTRESAEQARDKLKSMGFNPVGAVVPREQP